MNLLAAQSKRRQGGLRAGDEYIMINDSHRILSSRTPIGSGATTRNKWWMIVKHMNTKVVPFCTLVRLSSVVLGGSYIYIGRPTMAG